MHIIVGLTETAAATLLKWEKIDPELGSILPNVMIQKSESEIIWLIQAPCKVFTRCLS